jgi:hypothetical protein
MPKKVTQEQRDAVLGMLAHGQDRDTIATVVLPSMILANSVGILWKSWAT